MQLQQATKQAPTVGHDIACVCSSMYSVRLSMLSQIDATWEFDTGRECIVTDSSADWSHQPLEVQPAPQE